jgi:hypothetical protein
VAFMYIPRAAVSLACAAAQTSSDTIVREIVRYTLSLDTPKAARHAALLTKHPPEKLVSPERIYDVVRFLGVQPRHPPPPVLHLSSLDGYRSCSCVWPSWSSSRRCPSNR